MINRLRRRGNELSSYQTRFKQEPTVGIAELGKHVSTKRTEGMMWQTADSPFTEKKRQLPNQTRLLIVSLNLLIIVRAGSNGERAQIGWNKNRRHNMDSARIVQ